MNHVVIETRAVRDSRRRDCFKALAVLAKIQLK
jgi:hypothetical protein